MKTERTPLIGKGDTIIYRSLNTGRQVRVSVAGNRIDGRGGFGDNDQYKKIWISLRKRNIGYRLGQEIDEPT